MKRLPRESRMKMSLHFEGPFVVKKRLRAPDGNLNNVYVVVDETGKESVVPMCDLKRYHVAENGANLPPIVENVDEGDASGKMDPETDGAKCDFTGCRQ